MVKIKSRKHDVNINHEDYPMK